MGDQKGVVKRRGQREGSSRGKDEGRKSSRRTGKSLEGEKGKK